MTNSTTNGTFEISDPPTQQSNVMSDRDPLIKKESPFEGGVFNGLIKPCVAEFIGVTLFVFLGTLSVHQGVPLTIGLIHGFTVAIFVTINGPVSGGHLNPAVTLGVFLSGGIGAIKAIAYVLSQLLGGILGAALTKGVLTKSDFEAIHGGAQLLPEATSVGQGILCEVILTSILVTTVLMTAVDDEFKNPLAPLIIGLAVGVGIMAGANISGASMNPARSFGPAVVDSSLQSSQWDYHYIYWVGPGVGAVLAALWYRLLLAGPSKLLLSY